MSQWVYWLSPLPALALLGVLTWWRSVRCKDVGIVDSIWSLLFLLAGLVWAAQHSGPRSDSMLILIAIWAARLSLYITLRHHGQPEDRRYQAIRARNQPNFELKSLWLVFGLQVVIAWILAIPLGAVIESQRALSWWDAAGFALFIVGLAVESLADAQMASFRKRPQAVDAVMDSGLWRYSRHPNYFGECLLWWGIYAIAIGAGAPWTVFSPLIMTLLLLKVSGVALLERDLTARRPAYRDYIRRTSPFIPWWPRRSVRILELRGHPED